MNLKKVLYSAIDLILSDIIDIRRTIHANPELSGQEYNTARLVFSYLKKIGLKPKYHINKTGVSVKIKNGTGKTIVLRADTDALPIQENNSVSYKSKKKSIMHACGHDIHTASLLGAAAVLSQNKHFFNGTIICLFQPSEEDEPGGALGLIKEGAFPINTDAVFGLHVSPDFETGTIAVKSGIDYSGITLFDVKVIGKGGHGAMPEKTIDPIICTSQMISALQSIISREIAPYEPCVISIGSLHAGTRHNVIPDFAEFKGTIRTFSSKTKKIVVKRISEKLKAIAKSNKASVDIAFTDSYPHGYNDPDLTLQATTQFSTLLGKKNVIINKHPTMFSEDFSYYQKKAPGLFIQLGVKPPKTKNFPGIHTASFLPDENAIKIAIALHCAFTNKMKKSHW